MAGTTTQTPDDNTVPFASVPGLTQTHAAMANPRAGNGSIVMGAPPPTSVGPGGRITASGSQGGPSPLMTYLATLMGTGKTDPAATPPPPPPNAAPTLQDPTGAATLSGLHGTSLEAGGAVHEPQNHTRDQFISALRGVPTDIVNSMVQLRHQWTPQEMAQAQYLKELQAGGDPVAYGRGLMSMAFASPMGPMYGAAGAPIPDGQSGGMANLIKMAMAKQQQQ